MLRFHSDVQVTQRPNGRFDLSMAMVGTGTRHAIVDLSPAALEWIRNHVRLGTAFFDAWRRRVSFQFTLPLGQGRPTPDVVTWILGQPAICAALVWQDAAGARAFPDWTDAEKAELVSSFARAWNGESTGLADPPPNLLALRDTDIVETVLAESTAWPLYRELVAWSLAAELAGSLTWSVTGYDASSLALLFDSRQTFHYTAASGGHHIDSAQGAVVPAPPDRALAFLASNTLISFDSSDTIAQVLDWAHHNLVHYVGGSDTANVANQWQYRGLPPLTRVLAGTPLSDDPTDGIRHRTMGCHGTSGFFHSLLRVINVPARKLELAGHALVHFPEEHAYLSHGDDPYDRAWPSVSPETDARRLLIGEDQFEEWFGAAVPAATIANNIGRRPRELSLQNLSNYLLNAYCADRASGASHASGRVAQLYERCYTVAQLEASNLWTRMDAKLAALGGCSAVPVA